DQTNKTVSLFPPTQSLSLRTATDDKKHYSCNDRYSGNEVLDNATQISHHRCPALRLDRLALDRLPLVLCHRSLRRGGMKPLLNVIGEFNEIDLGNSRFRFKHNPIRFDTDDRGVLV